jgi:hypothetical protein
MNASRLHTWVRASFLFGVVYFLVGRGFSLPTDHVQVWRLAAWIVSGAAYAAHIWYEHVRLRHSPRSISLHVALGVAIGAFALAVAGALHSLMITSAISPLWLLALIAWPVVTAIPAFLVALAAGVVLAHRSRSANEE